MEIYIATVDECMHSSETRAIITNNLHCIHQNEDIDKDILNNIDKFLDTLRNNLTVIMETDYVDKVYRNSFYGYYSTKLRKYGRECIRLSFFEPDINEQSFTLKTLDEELIKKSFLGFLVIRPLSSSCIGRNVISPKAKKTVLNHMRICTVGIDTTVFGFKLKATGFPHSSQDGETMSCAENSIWSILEFFGNKYPEYKPVMPYDIIELLKPFSYERQIPSCGLTFEQISVALQGQGFGCKVYAKENPMFREVFTCYIESGIPLVICLEDKEGQGHAVVCIGRKDLHPSAIDAYCRVDILGVECYCWNQSVEDFIFNDDNLPCYQSVKFSNPITYSGTEGWEITHIVVPLHSRVYLDAELAIKASNYIAKNKIDIESGSVIKTFLVSNRCYREYLLKCFEFSEKARWKLLQINMPKFVWVTEISKHSDFIAGYVNDLIILDATGSSVVDDSYASLLYFQKQGKGTCFDESIRWFKEMEKISFPEKFKAFNENLQSFEQ
ncbi:MAG: hypothetical protein VB110_00015 [Bacteroidales bacterium]|jgi:hypothetical protein|nr:hypothetical protein [Bacteroidales bacterium]